MIIRRIGNVVYESELSPELVVIRLVFRISMLMKCLGDPSLVVPIEIVGIVVPIEIVGIKDNLSYEEILV